MRTAKYIITLLLGLTTFFSVTAQIEAPDIDEGRAVIEQKNISEDEIKARLRKRGIDIENLRPDQVDGLQGQIEEIIAEIEKERSEETDSTMAVTDFQAELADKVDDIAEKEVNEVVIDKADEVRERVKKGASVDEALSEEMTKTFHDHYRFSSNVFGHDIFYNKSLELFRTTKSATTPESYVLDAGDKLAINIFGVSQADLIYEIDEDGFIRPKNMYKIYLKGVPIGKAKILLRNRFRQAYTFSDGQFNVDLHTARTITINIFGEVHQQGSYTISALNTALNAIIAAGGPTDDGGVRQIEIMSDGKKRYLDVYEFIRNPGVQYNYYLHDNDLIYVPKAGKRISANGPGFKQSAVYELKDKENFNELVTIAGGLNPTVYKELVQHVSKANEEQIIQDYIYDEAEKQNIELLDGDIVIIRTSSVRYKNYVQVSGAVRHSGQFELKEGMKLGDVLEKAVFEPETYSDIAFLRRRNPDGTFKLIRLYPEELMKDSSSSANIELENEDVISIYAKSNFTDTYGFSIQGAVRTPSRYDWDPEQNITLYDAIVMSKGLRADAVNFGYIISTPTDNSLNRTYRMIDAGTAYRDPSSDANVRIAPNDTIVIPSKTQFTDQFSVEVSGAVRSPGKYIYNPTLNFYDMITMAGGLKLEAASNKIDIFRLKINENEPTYTYATTIEINRDYDPLTATTDLQLQPFDHIVVRYTPEFKPIQYVTITGEVKYPGLYAILDSNERISSLIQRAGGTTYEAFPEAGTFVRNQDGIGLVVTRIDKILKRERSPYNLVLKESDHVHIPRTIDVVTIDKLGTNAEELYQDNQNTGPQLKTVVNFKKRRRAGWYIRKFAGGYGKDGAKGKTFVQHPNGEVKKTFNILFFHITPKVKEGSEIHTALKQKAVKGPDGEEIVLFEPDKTKVDGIDRLSNLLTIVTTLSAITSSTVTTILLIEQLNNK